MIRFKHFLASCMLCITWVSAAEPQITYLQKGNQAITLFGTIHIAKPEFYPLPNAVTDSLKQADALAVELDSTDTATIMQTMQFMATEAIDPTQDLSQLLSASELKQLNDIAGPLAMSFQQLRPWAIAVTLSMLRAKEIGLTETGIDETLINLAKSASIPVIALETTDEQLSTFKGISEKEQIVFLKDVLSDDYLDDVKHTVNFWQHNDTASGDYLINKAQKTQKLYQALIVSRNRTMTQRIIQHNQSKKRLFVAVGALHLHGKDSIIALLKQQGYKEIQLLEKYVANFIPQNHHRQY